VNKEVMLEWASTPEKLAKEPIFFIDLTEKYPTIAMYS
jgi:hypothetical protein